MEKVRLGMIGCGNIAKHKHIPSVKQIAEAEIVAFCDIIRERAEEARDIYGNEHARVYEDYHELLAQADIDAIYVLTQNRLHSEISIAALEAGKHVLCEKPMAIDAAHAKLMLEAAEKSGKILTIGYQHRHDSDVQYVHKEAQNGIFGDIYYTKARVLRRRGVPTHGVFLDESEQGGGCLVDVGTHALDTVLWLMNNYEPDYVCGSVYHKLNRLGEEYQGNPWGVWDPEKFNVEDSAFGYIVMKNGATIVLETSWALNMTEGETVQYQLCGDKAGCDNFTGSLQINGAKHNTLYLEKPSLSGTNAAYYGNQGVSSAIKEQRVFIDACLGRGKLTVLPQQAYVVSQILTAIYESAKTGDIVRF